MAVSEMKMIPNEIGMIVFSLLGRRIGIEMRDGHGVGIQSPHRYILLFQQAVCGLFTFISAHGSYLCYAFHVVQKCIPWNESIVFISNMTVHQKHDSTCCNILASTYLSSEIKKSDQQ